MKNRMRSMSLSTRTALFCLGPFLAAACGGCGQQEYERRLTESAKYFAYLQKIDGNLAPIWKNDNRNPGPFEEVRVPLQFREIKKPPAVKNEKGEFVEPDVDPRQPDYVPIEFPGLAGAWEASFNVTVDGAPATRKGYIYALTNAYLLANQDENQRAKAADFTRDLLVLIAEKLSLPQLDFLNDVERETYPRVPNYTTPNRFDAYRFKSDQVRIDGISYTFEVYSLTQGEVQADLVIVLPASPDKVSERIPLMLERLKVSSKAAAAPARRGGGSAPAAPASNF